MSTVAEKVAALAKDRKFTLRRADYIFERILAKTDKFLVYDTQSKQKPLYTIPEDRFEEEWTHSSVIRLARGCLEAFSYLEENGFVLTQFDDKNLYVGSFSEDRGNFFRIMFKGHKDKSAPFNGLARRHRFSPPETETTEIYKSYAFSVGLMIVYSILQTNNKGGDVPNNLYADTSKLPELIKTAVDLCYKEGKEKPENKELFKVFLEDLLETDVKKRRSPKELLTYKWIIESDKLDYEEYQRELEENERAKQKEKEEEEKNKFN